MKFDEIKTEIDELSKDFIAFKNTVGELNAWDSWTEIKENMSLLRKLSQQAGIVAYLISERVEDVLNEEDVRKAFAKWLDEKIEMPWTLELFDDKIFEFLINFGITTVTHYMLKNGNFFRSSDKYATADMIAQQMGAV
jgi:hypothetical protein